MTSVINLSLCLLLFGGWNLAAAVDPRCVVPIVCDGQASWIELSKLQSTCPKSCESSAEQVQKAKDAFDATMRQLKKNLESLTENARRIAECQTTDASSTAKPEIVSKPEPTSDVITTTHTDVTTSSSETTLDQSTEATTVPTTQTAVTCVGFQWNGKCFWVNVTSPARRINYAEAAEMCAEQHARPANIYNNNTHYDQVMTYLRPKIPVEWSWLSIWLGMTYNPSTKVLSLYNGTMTSNQVKWYPGYPSSNTADTQMGVRVDNASSLPFQGMLNLPPSFNVHGVLCEIDE